MRQNQAQDLLRRLLTPSIQTWQTYKKKKTSTLYITPGNVLQKQVVFTNSQHPSCHFDPLPQGPTYNRLQNGVQRPRDILILDQRVQQNQNQTYFQLGAWDGGSTGILMKPPTPPFLSNSPNDPMSVVGSKIHTLLQPAPITTFNPLTSSSQLHENQDHAFTSKDKAATVWVEAITKEFS
jgi:hypothetical protein